MSFRGVRDALKPFRAAIAEAEKRAIAQAQQDVMTALDALIDITPVNTGSAVRNFNVSTGGPNNAVKPALGTQPPEPTNNLALGAEANREANANAAKADARAALSGMKKLAPIYVTNSVPHFDLIESGSAPGTPWKNRGPGGHTALLMAYLRNTGRWK